MIMYLLRHYTFTLSVLRENLKNVETKKTVNTLYHPTVSILIPAHNEEKVIGRLLKRITELTYPKEKMQVIVIDDASTDNTGKIAEKYSRQHKYIEVLHRTAKEGGKGKPAALNSTLKHITGEIIFCFDADYHPQKNILEKLTKEFANPKVGAVQGRVIVLNEPQNLVTRLVALERVGGYRVDQKARDNLELITQFGGTVGGVRREILERLGGWDEFILAEDTDLTFRVYLAGYVVRYVCDAECYEEAVEDWRAYWKQRYRWAKGHMQCAFKHSLSVIKSKKLSLKQKLDGLLLLNIYFLPVITLLAWITGISLYFFCSPRWLNIFWASAPMCLYSFVGNFAPFFEVGVGAYLDGRKRVNLLIPLLIFVFLYNIIICTKAFLDLLIEKITGKRHYCWTKTYHSGNGNSFIIN